MKLKHRLIIAFCTILIVPLLLFAVMFYVFMHQQMAAIEKAYGIHDISYSTISMSNSVTLVSKTTQRTYEDLLKQVNANPDYFLDKSNLDTLNQEAETVASYLLLRKGNEIYYSGDEKNSKQIVDDLPEFTQVDEEGTDSNSERGIYIGEDIQAFVKQIDFMFTDGSRGSLFLITSVTEALPQLRSLVVDVLISIVLILFFTACLLTIWIYHAVITPMQKLRIATMEIREGNLDYELDTDGEDEFAELFQDFEEMRMKLKESTDIKLKNDQENKELISNISHDLKTPITAVKGYVEGIMDGVADTPEKMDRYIRTIYNKANDMDRLINELTYYSKIDTNRIPYTFSKILVCDYFGDCAEEMGLDLESKQISFHYSNEVAKDTIIIADAEQLKKVINNIIGNSVKYMQAGKSDIELRIRDSGDFVQVEIEDNGKGISARDLPYIFDRFYRTDSSRNSSQGGSGIGLSIVKKIIEDHGGKIWANSRVGQGTVMYFVIRKYQEVPSNE